MRMDMEVTLMTPCLQYTHDTSSSVFFVALTTLNDETIKDRMQWLQARCVLQSIVAEVDKTVDTIESVSKKDQIMPKLHTWRTSLPERYRDLDEVYPREIMQDGRKFWLFCRYHEIKLRLWTGDSNPFFLREIFRDAQVVLSTVSTVPDSFILVDPYVAPVLCCAIQPLTVCA
jgi:hypothetical protein